jgi:ketosteroid isomerase-like protein
MPEVYRGHEGMRRWAADLREAWEFVDHTPLEVIDAGNAVAFLCRVRLRGRSTGIELDSRLGQVFWMEQGLIVREHDFADWDEALQTLGLASG